MTTTPAPIQDNFQKHKKLVKFFDAGKTAIKKIKAVNLFLDGGGTEPEQKRFLATHFSVIYSTILDSIQLMEVASQGIKPKPPPREEAQPSFDVLLRLMHAIPQVLRTRWQYNSLRGVIERALHPSNKHWVRGYGLAMMFSLYDAVDLEVVSHGVDARALLSLVVNSAPLYRQYGAPYAGVVMPDLPHFAFATATGPATCEEASEMLTRLLENLTARDTASSFSFWWAHLRVTVVPAFYPKVVRETGVVPDLMSPAPFEGMAPAEAQVAFVPRIAAWIKNPVQRRIAASAQDNARIIAEILRQACLLPLAHAPTMQCALSVYQAWVRGEDRPTPVTEHIQTYAQYIVVHAAGVFASRSRRVVESLLGPSSSPGAEFSSSTTAAATTATTTTTTSSAGGAASSAAGGAASSSAGGSSVTPTTSLMSASATQAAVALVGSQVCTCTMALGLYRLITCEWTEKWSPATWHLILSTLITVADDLMHVPPSPWSGPAPAGTCSPSSLDFELARALSAQCIEVLFNAWLRARPSGPEHWDRLRDLLARITHWPAAIATWRRAVVMLTKGIMTTVYSSPPEVGPPERRHREIRGLFRRKQSQGAAGVVPAPGTIFTAGDLSRLKLPVDLEVLYGLAMTLKESFDTDDLTTDAVDAFGMWEKMLGVIGDPNHLGDVKARTEAFLAFSDVVGVFYRDNVAPLYSIGGVATREGIGGDPASDSGAANAASSYASSAAAASSPSSPPGTSSSAAVASPSSTTPGAVSFDPASSEFHSSPGSSSETSRKPSKSFSSAIRDVFSSKKSSSGQDQHGYVDPNSPSSAGSSMSGGSASAAGPLNGGGGGGAGGAAVGAGLASAGQYSRTRSPSTLSSLAPLVTPPPALRCANTLLSVFGPWLFEAAGSRDPGFALGRAAAFAALCRIVCRHTDEALEPERLSDFFRLVQEGLSDSDVNVHNAILVYADHIFGFEFPGATLLAPLFLSAALRHTLSPAHKDPSLHVVHNAALRVVYSLMYYPRHFGTLELGTAADGAKPLLVSAIRSHIATFIPVMCKNYTSTQTRQFALWIVCLSVLEASTAEDVESGVRFAAQSLLTSPPECAATALQVFASLADDFVRLSDRVPSLDKDVVTHLCDAVLYYLGPESKLPQSTRDVLVRRGLWVALEWMLLHTGQAPGTPRDPALFKRFAATLEAVALQPRPQGSKGHPGDIQSTSRVIMQYCLIYLDSFRRLAGGAAGALFLNVSSADEDARPSPPGLGLLGSPRLFVLGDTLLIELQDFRRDPQGERGTRLVVRNAAGRFAWELSSTEQLAADMAKIFMPPPPARQAAAAAAAVAAAAAAEAAAAVTSPPLPSTPTTAAMEDADLEPPPPPPAAAPLGEDEVGSEADWASVKRQSALLLKSPDILQQQLLAVPEDDVSEEPAIPLFPMFTDDKALDPQGDMLGSLLDAIDSRHPEIRKASDLARAAVPNLVSRSLTEDTVQISSLLQRVKDEQAAAFVAPAAPQDLVDPSGAIAAPPSSASASGDAPAHDGSQSLDFLSSRSILSELGLLSPGVREKLSLVDTSSPKFETQLVGLDMMAPRSTVRIGVVYVGPGQDTDLEILSNTRGSDRFEAFLGSLGWDVELATHREYTGGLSRVTLADGPTAPYYATPTREMAFHVTTRMPNHDIGDDGQPAVGHVDLKKRLLAGDEVQIVWCEDVKDYWVRTVAGSSTKFFIIVYPLPSGLHRIQTVADPDWNEVVGPLMDGAVVVASELGTLVRQTCHSASACLAFQRQELAPPIARLVKIREIASEFAVTISPQHFIACLYDTKMAGNITKKTAGMLF